MCFSPGSAMRIRLSAVLIAAFAFATSSPAPAPAAPAAPAAGNIELKIEPVRWNRENRTDMDAGRLEWAGGIEITSPHKDFGGWSALAVSADGSTLLSLSDKGNWLTAQILYDEKGRLSGLGEAVIAPLTNLDGKPSTADKPLHSKGLAVDGPDPLHANAYVSFERPHRIWRYDLAAGGFTGKPVPVIGQRNLPRMRSDGGIEALAVMMPGPKDTTRLFAVTENSRDPRGNIRAFIIEGRTPRRMSLRLSNPYRPTDVARLPNGDYLLLERHFSLLAGAGMQLRHIRQDDIKAGTVIDGEVLLQASAPDHSIDNMEGLAIRRDTKGSIWVYVISDNNFNPMQRTLLHMFRLKQQTTIMPRHTLTPGG